MRYSFCTFFIFVIFLPFALASSSQDGPFAVVELFSSQGCSSCPPADLLVRKLTSWARQNNEPVYPLVFHVDYWNHLGWRDIFSRAEYSERQNKYARIFKDQGKYTPQMIINGSDAFVGSDQKKLQKSLDRELTIPAQVDLQMSLTKPNGQLMIDYKVEGFSQGDVINLALVERALRTPVTAGENVGRILHHDNVVKEFQTLRLTQVSGEVIIPLRKIVNAKQASVIVYVQNPETMLIKAAKQLDVDNG